VTRQLPYAGIQSPRVITSVINGMRPSVPDDCPAGLDQLMADCWHASAARRPSFDEVARRLAHLRGDGETAR
jgi:hypothetical protein